MVKNITWPVVAVIGIVLGAVVALAYLGRDTTALLALGGALFAGLGLNVAQVQGVKEQTNGQTTQLVDLLGQLSHRLASSSPVPVPVVIPVATSPAPDTPTTVLDPSSSGPVP